MAQGGPYCHLLNEGRSQQSIQQVGPQAVHDHSCMVSVGQKKLAEIMDMEEMLQRVNHHNWTSKM